MPVSSTHFRPVCGLFAGKLVGHPKVRVCGVRLVLSGRNVAPSGCLDLHVDCGYFFMKQLRFMRSDVPLRRQGRFGVVTASAIIFLAGFLLSCGDVEANPGPGHHGNGYFSKFFGRSTSSQPKNAVENDTSHTTPRPFDTDPDDPLHMRMLSMAGYPQQHYSNKGFSVDKLTESVDKLESWCQSLQEENDEMKHDLSFLTSKCFLLQEECESLNQWKDLFVEKMDDQMDKLEAFSRRNNVRFFNVFQEQDENDIQCIRKVVQLLNRFFPEKIWTVDDIERAHRSGPRSSDRNPQRTIIVRMHRWQDKLSVLQSRDSRREMAEELNIRVASDVTDRQNEIIQAERDAGRHAHIWKGRLIFGKSDSPQREHLHSHHSVPDYHKERDGAASMTSRDIRSQTRTEIDSRPQRTPSETCIKETEQHVAVPRHQARKAVKQPIVAHSGPPSIMDMNHFPTLQSRNPQKSARADAAVQYSSLASNHKIHVASGNGAAPQHQGDIRHRSPSAPHVGEHDVDSSATALALTNQPVPDHPKPQRTPQPKGRTMGGRWGVKLVLESESISGSDVPRDDKDRISHRSSTTSAQLTPGNGNPSDTPTTSSFAAGPDQLGDSWKKSSTSTPHSQSMPPPNEIRQSPVRDMVSTTPDLPPDEVLLTPAASPTEADTSQTVRKELVDPWSEVEFQSPEVPQAQSDVMKISPVARPKAVTAETQDYALVCETPKSAGRMTRSRAKIRVKGRQTSVTDTFPVIASKAARTDQPIVA